MSITPPALVSGPARVPFPYGLFSVLALNEGSTAHWQGGGVQFESLGTPPTGAAIGSFACAEDEETPGLPKTFDGGLNLSTATPFTVYGSYVCSPIGNPLAHALNVAQARLAAWEEMQVERAFWLGQAGNTPSLEGSTPTDLGTLPALEAFAEFEAQMGSTFEALGVIHVGRGTALQLIADKVIEVKANRLYTRLGTPVVAGRGYLEGEAYATPALLGYRSEVFTSSNVQGDLLDRSQNNLYAVAERTYVIGFDDEPSPLHVTLSTPDPSPL